MEAGCTRGMNPSGRACGIVLVLLCVSGDAGLGFWYGVGKGIGFCFKLARVFRAPPSNRFLEIWDIIGFTVGL